MAMQRRKVKRASIQSEIEDKFPKDMMSPDENSLNREWVRQPKLMYEIGLMSAKARRQRDYAYVETKIVLAEECTKIRSSPKDYLLAEKPSIPMVNDTAMASDEYKKANRRHLIAQERHDVLLAATEALKQRCKALENLVKLHAMNYYGEPRVGDEVDQETIDDLKKKQARKPLKRRSRNG